MRGQTNENRERVNMAKKVARLDILPRQAADAEQKTAEAQMGDGQDAHHTTVAIPAASDGAEHVQVKDNLAVASLDLDKAKEPEEIDLSKELKADEARVVKAALQVLAARGYTQITLAGGTAKMFDPGKPDEAPNYEAAKSHAEKAYKGDQSKNDNTMFTTTAPDPETGVGGSAKKMTIESSEMRKLIAQEVKKATREAVASVFERFAANGYTLTRTAASEGVQQTNQSGKATDTQKEMEKSNRPTGDVQDGMPFEGSDPADIAALERVDQMPFDKVNPAEQGRGRKINRNPSKL